MGSRLINVRLDAEHLRKAQALRDRGIVLSDVVREAIDERFQRLQSEPRADVKALLHALFEKYPDPPGLPPRDYDVHDRVAARQAILRKIRSIR